MAEGRQGAPRALEEGVVLVGGVAGAEVDDAPGVLGEDALQGVELEPLPVAVQALEALRPGEGRRVVVVVADLLVVVPADGVHRYLPAAPGAGRAPGPGCSCPPRRVRSARSRRALAAGRRGHAGEVAGTSRRPPTPPPDASGRADAGHRPRARCPAPVSRAGADTDGRACRHSVQQLRNGGAPYPRPRAPPTRPARRWRPPRCSTSSRHPWVLAGCGARWRGRAPPGCASLAGALLAACPGSGCACWPPAGRRWAVPDSGAGPVTSSNADRPAAAPLQSTADRPVTRNLDAHTVRERVLRRGDEGEQLGRPEEQRRSHRGSAMPARETPAAPGAGCPMDPGPPPRGADWRSCNVSRVALPRHLEPASSGPGAQLPLDYPRPRTDYPSITRELPGASGAGAEVQNHDSPRDTRWGRPLLGRGS